ncbi:hypothetical protein ABZ613_13865 [Streptomyces collinus]|uniref:hypothetical protein n=1 Tax=Streptomyces collinus TaxID=42684 RepID=UPI0033CCC5CC
MAKYFEDEQRELALSMNADNVRYRCPQSAFKGKRICDSPEGINGVVAGPNGDGDFHHGDKNPNKTGTSVYAQAFMTARPTAALTRKDQ